MPRRAGHACVPGCGAIVPAGTRRCPEHRAAEFRRQDANRGSSAARGYGARWQRRRAAWLAAHPLCVACSVHGRTTAANVVDHVIPKAHGGPDDETNLQSLCAPCHNAKTMRESVSRGAVR